MPPRVSGKSRDFDKTKRIWDIEVIISKKHTEETSENRDCMKIFFPAFGFFLLFRIKCGFPEVSHSFQAKHGYPIHIVVNDAVEIIVKASFKFYISRVKCGIPEVSQSF